MEPGSGPRPDADSRASRRSRIALGLGATLGAALAASGLLGPTSGDDLGSGAIARVNDRTVTREEYERAVALLAADSRNPLTDERRAHVLARLIDEELLVQRGVEIGLVDSDRAVRSAIVSAMIESIVAETASAAPSPGELEAFYEENASFFARPSRLWVQEIAFRLRDGDGDDAAARARRAEEALRAGTPFAEVRAEYGDRPVAPVPDALLPPQKLREYLGPSLTRAVAELSPGEVTEPLPSPAGLSILRLVELEAERTPPLESVRAQVEAEWIRRAGDTALRTYLDELRDRADLALAPDAPR